MESNGNPVLTITTLEKLDPLAHPITLTIFIKYIVSVE
jgi:hypothetical protein